MSNKPASFFIKYWIPVLTWAGVIFYLSSLTSVSLPKYPDSDKFLHLIEYAFLAFLFSRLFRNSGYSFSQKRYRVYFFSVMFTVFYGLTDEVHQYFVPGRYCSIWDLLADGAGAGLGAYLYTRLNPNRALGMDED